MSADEKEIVSGGLTLCRLGQLWCCTDEYDCDNLARDGDVYVCNERYNWELLQECDGPCVDGECKDECGECQDITEPECDGTIVSGGYDNCGCEKSSICKPNVEEDTEETLEECDLGYTLTKKPCLYPEPEYYCKINKEFTEFSSCSEESDCNEGFSCISPYSEPRDYRCVPTSNYQMSCGCEPDGGCWCS